METDIFGDDENEMSVKHILLVCSKLDGIMLPTMVFSYFEELADPPDITMASLMVFIR